MLSSSVFRARRWTWIFGVAAVVFCVLLILGLFERSLHQRFADDPVHAVALARAVPLPPESPPSADWRPTDAIFAAPLAEAAGTPPDAGVLPGKPMAEGSAWSLTMRDEYGRESSPQFHLDERTEQIVVDERAFAPGVYAMELRGPGQKAEGTIVRQDVVWGVLAMNADQDRYRPGDTARLAFGVLDEEGEIICDAFLTLSVRFPDGSETTLSTQNGGIRVTDTCGKKEASLLAPDYETTIALAEAGLHPLTLNLAARGAAPEATMHGVLDVAEDPPFIVKRTAATRLWPFGPSTMEIDVEFADDFSGMIVDTLPEGFVLSEAEPPAAFATDGATRDIQIQWSGSWKKGEHASLRYSYDAPDISPVFYLIGPLALRSENAVLRETRAWQIANDAARTSNYIIPSDVISSGGGDWAMSSNYRLADTIGEGNIDISRTANYTLSAGYRQTIGTYLSMACSTSIAAGTIVSNGQRTGSGTCIVTTDDQAGYNLAWQVRTGSGGMNTGSLISQFEDVIRPFTPAVEDTPEPWLVDATASEWGARLRSSSTDTDAKWGIDNVTDAWLNVGTGSYTIVERPSATSPQGSVEILQFRVEVGGSYIQPTGTYETTVTLTVTAP